MLAGTSLCSSRRTGSARVWWRNYATGSGWQREYLVFPLFNLEQTRPTGEHCWAHRHLSQKVCSAPPSIARNKVYSTDVAFCPNTGANVSGVTWPCASHFSHTATSLFASCRRTLPALAISLVTMKYMTASSPYWMAPGSLPSQKWRFVTKTWKLINSFVVEYIHFEVGLQLCERSNLVRQEMLKAQHVCAHSGTGWRVRRTNRTVSLEGYGRHAGHCQGGESFSCCQSTEIYL